MDTPTQDQLNQFNREFKVQEALTNMTNIYHSDEPITAEHFEGDEAIDLFHYLTYTSIDHDGDDAESSYSIIRIDDHQEVRSEIDVEDLNAFICAL